MSNRRTGKRNEMRLTVLLFASLVVSSMNVLGHGGGLNKCGCHMNRKTNTCHCHRAPRGGCGPECYARSNETSDANANFPAELARPLDMRDGQATSDCAEYGRQSASVPPQLELECSAVKITERTPREEATQVLHAARKGRHPPPAPGRAGAGFGSLRGVLSS